MSMRSSLYVLGAVAGLAGCASPHPAATVAGPPPLALPAALTAPHATLLFGDIHGTRELPAFVGRVVSALAATQPVVLALEIPSEQVPSLPAFVASDGGPAARAAMLRDAWWRRPYQDGRSSVAMLALIDTARGLRASGARVDVVCFDPVRPPGHELDEELREANMARALIAQRAARPDAAFVIYAGNLHVRRAAWEPRPGFAWMAMRMASAGVTLTTLDASFRKGAAWICTGNEPDTCGTRPMDGRAGVPGIALEPSPDGGFDGRYDVGPITASPPAAASSRLAR
jgi:hypothetical protein